MFRIAAARDIMTRNGLRVNEKRWQRKRLFQERRPRPLRRFIVLLLIVTGLLLLAGWLGLPPFDASGEATLL